MFSEGVFDQAMRYGQVAVALNWTNWFMVVASLILLVLPQLTRDSSFRTLRSVLASVAALVIFYNDPNSWYPYSGRVLRVLSLYSATNVLFLLLELRFSSYRQPIAYPEAALTALLYIITEIYIVQERLTLQTIVALGILLLITLFLPRERRDAPAKLSPRGSLPAPMPDLRAETAAGNADTPIFLLLRRSQREGGIIFKRTIFMLDVRAELPDEQLALIRKYDLARQTIYSSKNRKKYAQNTTIHFDTAQASRSTGTTLYRTARGVASLVATALSLRITIDSLTNGQHIECRDMDELLGAESAIVDACKTLKTYIEIAETFDGREALLSI